MLFYLQVFVQSLPKEMLLTVLTVDALPSANTNCYTKPVLNKGRRVDVCMICTYMVGMKEMSTCFNSKSQVIFPMNPSYLENHFRTSFVKKKRNRTSFTLASFTNAYKGQHAQQLKKQTQSAGKLLLLILKKETNLSHVKGVNLTSITIIDYLSKREGIAGKDDSRPYEGF